MTDICGAKKTSSNSKNCWVQQFRMFKQLFLAFPLVYYEMCMINLIWNKLESLYCIQC